MTTLRRRLLGMIPALDYGLERLLNLLDLEETRAVASAAVPLHGSPRLLLNPDFVDAFCQDDASLFSLVLHELHHVLLGHTRLYPRSTSEGGGIDPAANIAFDAVINAMLCRRDPTEGGTRLFRRTYRSDRFPEMLLRPPEGFPLAREVDPSVPSPYRELLDDLYYSGTGTFSEVHELVRAQLDGLDPDLLLLGHHPEEDEGLGPEGHPALFDAVRRIVERWPQPPDPRVGRSLDEALRSERVVVQHRSPHQVLARALRAATRQDGSGRWSRGEGTVAIHQAVPSRDRRAFALAAAGHAPLLWQATLPQPRRTRGPRPVDVYLDVSGSCGPWLPHFLTAVHSCRHLVAPTVFQFSTRVVELPLSDLAKGRIETTGGTEGAAFTRHLRERGSRAAVVVTDGYVGAIPPGDTEACQQARLQVVLVPGGWHQDLQTAAVGFHQLEAS